MPSKHIDNTRLFAFRHMLTGLYVAVLFIAMTYLLVPMLGAHSACPQSLRDWCEDACNLMGMRDVMHSMSRSDGDLILACLFVLFFIGFMRFTRRTFRGVTWMGAIEHISALVITVMVMATLSIVLPSSEPVREGKGPSIISQLQTIRSQLELYSIQHNGQYPRLGQFWQSLTNETDVQGNILSPGTSPNAVGPYLQQPAINSITNDSTVAADHSGSWKYDETTGEVWLVLPQRVIDEWYWHSSMINEEIVPADYDIIKGKRTPLSAWDHVTAVVGPMIKATWGRPLVQLGVMIVIWWFISGWFEKHLARQRLYDQMLRLLPWIGGASLIGCFVSAFWLSDQAGFALCVFPFTFLWSAGCRLHLLQHPHYQRAWKDGSACLKCGYDLTGTLASNGLACPECGEDLELAPVRELNPLRRAA